MIKLLQFFKFFHTKTYSDYEKAKEECLKAHTAEIQDATYHNLILGDDKYSVQKSNEG